MNSEALIPWFAWLTPRLLLLFGVGFLVANLKVGFELVRYHRAKRSALLVWPRPKPRYYAMSLLIGVILGLLLAAEILLKRPVYSLFGEAMMFIYYILLFPLATRIARGFYQDGIWAEGGFVPYSKIGGLTWREGEQLTLVMMFRWRNFAKSLVVPHPYYGAARRLLRDKIATHDIHFTGKTLDLGVHDERDDV